MLPIKVRGRMGRTLEMEGTGLEPVERLPLNPNRNYSRMNPVPVRDLMALRER